MCLLLATPNGAKKPLKSCEVMGWTLRWSG